MTGSAIPGKRWAFVSLPKGNWAVNQFESKGLCEELRSCLNDLPRLRGVAVRLYHPVSEHRENFSAMLMPEGVQIQGLTSAEMSAHLRQYYQAETPVQASNTTTVHSVFVCTHGKRDLCCAKFGNPVFHAFRRAASFITDRIEVRECTHLGGDRFAPTVLVFPSGHMYGHVRPPEVEEILDAERTGTPFSPRYRGCVLLEGASQLAEAVAQRVCYERGISGHVEILGVDAGARENDASFVKLAVASSDGEWSDIEMRCRRRSFRVSIDCGGVSRGETKVVKRWVVDSLKWGAELLHPTF